jgi:multidrug efflux system outer membrane protein
MKRTIAGALSLVWLVGCMVGPDYERPKVDVPPAWRMSDKAAKAITNPAWWEQYGDPVLNELVKTALEENKDLQIAAARIDQFLGQLTTTRAALYPQVGIGGSAGRERVSENFGPQPLSGLPGTHAEFNNFQVGLSASWEIDLWGKVRRATEAARASLLSSEEARKSVALTLVSSVTNSYVNLRDLDKQLEITRQTAKAYESIYNIIKLRYDFGWVSAMEKHQAKEQYEHAAANIPFFEKAVAQEENNLSVLLGRNPGPINRGKSIDELALPVVPGGLPSEILENRPDVRQIEQNLVAANANIGAAKAQYYPSISLTGFFGTQSSDISKLFTAPSRIWGVAAPVTMPIFTGGAIGGQVETAEAVQRELVVRYKQILQTAFREVNDSLVDQDRTKEQLAGMNRQIDALREYVRLAWVRFNEGYSSYLEVTYSQNLLYTAELDRAGVQRVLFQAYSNLYKAMGIGG